jgi:hypothetical protein
VKWQKYNKAITAAVGLLAATAVGVYRGEDPDSIPQAAEQIIAALTALSVWLVPNAPDDAGASKP